MRDIAVFYPTNHCDSVRDFSEQLKEICKKYNFINFPRKYHASKYDEFMTLAKTHNVLMAWIGGGVEPKFGTTNSTVELLFQMTDKDFEVLKSRGVKVIGLSDVTYILAALQNNGMVCYYGPNLYSKFITCGGEDERTVMYNSLETALNNNEYVIDLADKDFNLTEMPTVVYGGKAKGRIVGGNTETICAALRMYPEYALKRQTGDIIFLEAVCPSYDEEGFSRQLKYLKQHCFFVDASAIIIGKGQRPWVNVDGERKMVDRSYECENLIKSVKEFLPKGIPVIINAPSGHVSPMMTIPLGCKAELDADNLTLKIIK